MFQGTETIEHEEPVVDEMQGEVEQDVAKEEIAVADEQESTEQQPSPEDIQEGSQKDYRERQRYQRKVQEYKQKSQQIEEVAKKLAEENLVLRQYVDGYGQAASHHYSEKLKLKINQTQQKLEEAEANDDIKAKTEAIRELTKLAEEEAYLERYNYKNSQPKEQRKQEQTQPVNEPQPQSEDTELPEEVEDWFDEHPWLDQRRQEFNSEMRDEVYAYSQTLARRWKRAGKENQIDSPAFLEEVGKYAKENFPEYYSPTNRRPPLNSNNRGVSQPPVKKQATTQTAPRFTQAEREMMQHFGMTEKEWLESKKDVEKRSRGIS